MWKFPLTRQNRLSPQKLFMLAFLKISIPMRGMPLKFAAKAEAIVEESFLVGCQIANHSRLIVALQLWW
jgi:uncharacterized ubiquitin-like protein YukD